MVRLALPMVMVGVLVALAAKVMLVLPPPGILAFTEAVSLGLLELENKGDREKLTSLGLLASKMLPLLSEVEICQESRFTKLLEPEPVRMLLLARVVLPVPLKIQRVSLVGLSWLG